QITNQKAANYRLPKPSTEGIMFLSEENGIVNRKLISVSRDSMDWVEFLLKDSSKVLRAVGADMDIADSLILSSRNTRILEYLGKKRFLTITLLNIVTYDVNARTGTVAEAYKIKDDYKVFLEQSNSSGVDIGASLHQQLEDR